MDHPRTEPWHRSSTDEVLSALATDAVRGLSESEAARRRERDGPNQIQEAGRRSLGAMVLSQFTDVMIVVLIAAAVVSGVFGELVDTLAIVVILVLNAVIGATQELRAERAIAALKQMAAPRTETLRAGRWQSIEAAELVRGDVVRLEAGDVVSADLRLLEVGDLAIDESPLTGESLPIEKTTAPLADGSDGIGDRTNLAYRGTLVTRGRGTGVVVATGMATELGRIASLLEGAVEVRTPLQLRLARFGRNIAALVLAICAVVFGLGVLRGEDPLLMFLTAVSLAVAAVPEALPAVVTISLALGARRMARERALVRRLPAVETLGSVTHACADKTGTLTQNRMSVGSLATPSDVRRSLPGPNASEPWRSLARAFALNNDCERDEAGDEPVTRGDPTEVALFEAVARSEHDPDELRRRWPRAGELAFEGQRQRMSTWHRTDDGRWLVYVKGSPEVVLSRSHTVLGPDGEQPLDVDEWRSEASRLAASGARVLAFARRELDEDPAGLAPESVERDLTFLGLAGLIDPPRPGARDAVRECRSAGITPVMITGDHPGTALAIAREIGIVPADTPDDAVVTGAELERLEPQARAERMRATRVFARVSPEQKIAIVRALQEAGEFVAMTGDGVNDAPALKQAEIGIAMGERGTEVAREASDMVLVDDDFGTIVAAVREGRRVYDNVRKFVRYTMTSNSGEIWTLLLAPLLGLPLPLTPIQILWINLVTDGLPGLALSAEPAEPNVMQRPPRPRRESVFAHGLGWHVAWVGLLIGALSILGQAWGLADAARHWPSIVFTVLTFSQLAHALAVRSERRSLFTLGLRSNLPLALAVAGTALLQLVVVYFPPLQGVFGTSALSAGELGVCILLSLVVVVAVELEKLVQRRRERTAASTGSAPA